MTLGRWVRCGYDTRPPDAVALTRPGVRVGDLTREQRELASDMLASSYGDDGLVQAERVLTVEAEARGLRLDPAGHWMLSRHLDADYWVRILGQPGSGAPWAWRLSGHHLVAHATLHGSEVSTTPQFFGASPTTVPSGPHAGLRGLGETEDLARSLVQLLGEDQRAHAVWSTQPPEDIISRSDPVVARPPGPAGLSTSAMDAEQTRLCETLIGHYLGRAPAPVANRAWRELRDAGQGNLSFGWAGGLHRGQGHYYALSGPTLLIEYDNTQEDANHIHSVWRDLTRDWGGDALARHYRSQHTAAPLTGRADR